MVWYLPRIVGTLEALICFGVGCNPVIVYFTVKNECTVASHNQRELSVLFRVNICVDVFQSRYYLGLWYL